MKGKKTAVLPLGAWHITLQVLQQGAAYHATSSPKTPHTGPADVRNGLPRYCRVITVSISGSGELETGPPTPSSHNKVTTHSSETPPLLTHNAGTKRTGLKWPLPQTGTGLQGPEEHKPGPAGAHHGTDLRFVC